MGTPLQGSLPAPFWAKWERKKIILQPPTAALLKAISGLPQGHLG